MSDRPRFPLVPRLLFMLTVGCAAALLLLVLVGPWLDAGEPRPEGWDRLVEGFARDGAVRRTSVAAGLGLLATAWVCFRAGPVLPRRKPRPPQQPPAGGAVGA
jgi:hypothetical protein